MRRRRGLLGAGALASVAVLAVATGSAATTAEAQPLHPYPAQRIPTSTPIKHVVVIFGENIAFDHYFGTYPNAANTDGTPFQAARNTPKVNGLDHKLLTDNPNAYNPKRLTHEQALTCDQNHNYGAEQAAFNGGKMDKFVEKTETDKCTGQPVLFGEPGLVMDYFDGNTVTGMWNYAQHYSLNDNSFDANFGPSTPGAINLVSGNTHGVQAVNPVTHEPVSDAYAVQSPDANGVGTMINDPDPAWDDCSDKNHTSTDNLATMHGRNVGDLLNQRHVTWGWFQGGFRPTGSANGYAVCGTTHANIGGAAAVDYSPHHEPFQYYPSTANPKHLPPSSVQAIGQTDRANHQYDIADFNDSLQAYFDARGEFPEGPGVPGRSRGLLGPAGRAAVRGQRSQQDPAVPRLALDGDRPGVRRLGRLVRPRLVPGDQRFSRRFAGPGRLHGEEDDTGRLRGPLRLRPAAPPDGDFPVQQGEPRRPHTDGPDLGTEVHRGQLVRRSHRRQLVRFTGELDVQHVQLLVASGVEADARPEDRGRGTSVVLVLDGLVARLAASPSCCSGRGRSTAVYLESVRTVTSKPHERLLARCGSLVGLGPSTFGNPPPIKPPWAAGCRRCCARVFGAGRGMPMGRTPLDRPG